MIFCQKMIIDWKPIKHTRARETLKHNTKEIIDTSQLSSLRLGFHWESSRQMKKIAQSRLYWRRSIHYHAHLQWWYSLNHKRIIWGNKHHLQTSSLQLERLMMSHAYFNHHFISHSSKNHHLPISLISLSTQNHGGGFSRQNHRILLFLFLFLFSQTLKKSSSANQSDFPLYSKSRGIF